jgi:hypothetical protein
MNKLNQTLSEVLDVEPIDYQTTEIVEVKTPVEDDAEFARTNIRDLISKGNSAVDNLLLVANASEHPRAYEVAAGLIKNLADLNKDLLEIQKRKRDLDPTQSKSNSTTNIDKAVFVGSTTELVKFLKNNK